MPIIVEERDSVPLETDFSQLLDLPDSSFLLDADSPQHLSHDK